MNAYQETQQAAYAFLDIFYKENQLVGFDSRWQQVKTAIQETGKYELTTDELAYGAKLAWRNSTRCIGRYFWKSLQIKDVRHIQTIDDAFQALCEHLRFATNKGKIRSLATIFSAESGLRILNRQLVRYAGYETAEGIIGDPMEVAFTQFCQSLGWQGKGTGFDVLPLVIQQFAEPPVWFEIPDDCQLHVQIEHPTVENIASLGLQWYAVPVISNLTLSIGGLSFPFAPFNGWYMLSEIATRNFGDIQRYNQLPKVAELLGLETKKNKTLWKDKALLELNIAVLHSFEKAGVMLVDPHTAAEQFMKFVEIEEKNNRTVQAEWSWVVPPTAGSTTEVFHREFSNVCVFPNFIAEPAVEEVSKKCPFSHVNLSEN
ncbi:MAG: nitric oxide synthase oxygenase [Spirosomataceae bacterium]